MMMRASLVGVLGTLTCAAALPAQGVPQRPPTWEARLQVGVVPIDGGTASYERISTWLPSVGLTYRFPFAAGRIAVEAGAAYVGEDRDPYHPTPTLAFLGTNLRLTLTPRPGPVEPYLVVGAGSLHVDGNETVCGPPSCFESRPNYPRRTFMALLGGAGLRAELTTAIALRGDVRVYFPQNAGPDAQGSGAVRAELALGLAVRL